MVNIVFRPGLKKHRVANNRGERLIYDGTLRSFKCAILLVVRNVQHTLAKQAEVLKKVEKHIKHRYRYIDLNLPHSDKPHIIHLCTKGFK